MEKFNKLNLGGKLIIISTAVAIISLFMDWVDVGFFSVSGFQQDGYLLLIFFLYPLIVSLNNKNLNKIAGIISSALAVLGALLFLQTKNTDFFGESVNFAATGLYVFIIASVGLLIGSIKYAPSND